MAFRFGYFNAHRTEREVDGQTVVSYDRTYNVDDFNDYFKYVISPNGIFKNSGNRFTSGDYTHCKLRFDDSGTIQDYFDTDNDDSTDPVESIKVNVSPGKGLIDGHWFINDDNYPVYLNISDSVSNRYDAIVIRINIPARNMGIRVRENISNPNTFSPSGYTASSKSLAPNSNGVLELMLGYVLIYGTNTTEYSNGKRAKIYNTLGDTRCPWISHLVLPDGNHDADEYIAQYQTEIQDWIQSIMDQGGIDQKVTIIKIHVDGGSKVSSRINLKDAKNLNTGTKANYSLNANDSITAYYNGLYLKRAMTSGDTGDFDVSTDGGITCLTVHNGQDIIPAGNTVDIEITEAATTNFPNGNNIKY